ncbi:MAG: preprotein translocase subunit SecA [Candidatus Bipolaricaulota bacterium]|nr:preprotein translocase subunit SecA [Candidatus Bipolaricaulota bacterium]
MPLLRLLRRVRDSNERKLRRLLPILAAVNHWSAKMKDLSDEELQAKTAEFRRRLRAGETPDQLLPEAFAVVREAARRTIGLYPFDVQVLGGIVLHQRRIAEMKTGEGKTLVATMPAYLNALVGKVHIVTVNDYLAKRDRHWMGPVYEFLGLSVGLLQEDTPPAERKRAYQCDVVYGTNAQFGFDYLRDHMVLSRDQKVQGPLDYAIIDEIDYILIDEARTPLIISGPTEETARLYREFARLARLFKPGEDFEVDEAHRRLSLTEKGWEKAEKLLKFDNIADPRAATARYHLETALKALVFYKRDRDYIVKDGRVIIVDEFTGRLMPDRRYSGGLHQAIEAKEGLPIQREHQTLAQITLQHYFRLYKGLAGMTGTAKTEEEEFKRIYGLDVVQIPTNRPMIRYHHPDVIFRTRKAKFEAVAEKVAELHRQGRPVLIGTTSIEDSEYLSQLLTRRGLPHQVLNAKYHEKEAMIVAQAGRYGAITIATNMAGRGTDILLGGNPEYRARQEADPRTEPEKYQELLARYRKEAEEERRKIVRPADPRSPYGRWVLEQIRKWCRETGREFRPEEWREIYQGGLFVIGCQRHEARRIDDQLAGRAGRQGDPGEAQFFLSLEDDLLRLFGGERLAALMERLGVKEGEAITHDLLTRAIRRAQKRVEERNFEIRKRLLEYDEIMAKQRDAIYALRERFLLPAPGETPNDEELREHLRGMAEEFAEILVERHVPRGKPPEAGDLEGLRRELAQVCEPVPELPARRWEELLRRVQEALREQLDRQWARLAPYFPVVARLVVLRTVDENWRLHLLELDDLREGIGLRAYGGTDPLVEFKREAHRMFEEMLVRSEEQVMRVLLSPRLMVRVEGPPAPTAVAAHPPAPARRPAPPDRVGRNDPCPCGSGRKYKHCCGKNA